MTWGRVRFDPLAATCMASGSALVTAATGPLTLSRFLVIHLALFLSSVSATYRWED